MSKKIVIGTLLAFAAVFFAYYFLIGLVYPGLKSSGDFQDLFAGLNTLFSGLAFLGLLGAIMLQREELSLQRKELELTRVELKRSAKAQENSQRELSKQAASLKETAKLNGLSAMLQHKNSLIETEAIGRYGSSGINKVLQEEANVIISKIQHIIDSKE